MRKPIDAPGISRTRGISRGPHAGLSFVKDDRSAHASFSPIGGEGAPKGRMRGPFVSLPEPAPTELTPHPALRATFPPRTGRRTGGEADASRSRNPHTLRWTALILAPGIVIASLMPAAAQMAPATPNPWTAGAGAAVTNSVIGMSAGVVAGMALAPQATAPGVVYVVPTRPPKPDPDDIGPKASDAIGPPPPAQGPVNYVTPPTVVQVPAYYGSASDGGAVSPSYAPAYGATSYGGQTYGGQAYGGQAYGTDQTDGGQGAAPYGGGQAADPNAPAAPQNYVASTPPAPWSAGWYSYCAGRYPSFNPQTGNYTTSDGKTYFCR